MQHLLLNPRKDAGECGDLGEGPGEYFWEAVSLLPVDEVELRPRR